MQQDALTMIAKDLAHDGSITAVNLRNSSAGPGRKHMIQVNGNGLAGADGLIITTGATSGLGTTIADFTFTAAELNAGVTVEVPQHVQQYVGVELTGTTSAGTWSAGLALEEGQTNF